MNKSLIVSMLLYAGGVLFSMGACRENNQIEPASNVGPPSSTIPENRYGQPLIYYAQVNKAGNYFRRMFIDSLSAQAVRQTGELPENALLVMETWFGNDQSTVFIRQKQNGAWLSGSFSPGSPDFRVMLNSSCNNCHTRAAVTDLTFTRPLLSRALQGNQPQVIECNESSFTPCDLSVYEGNP